MTHAPEHFTAYNRGGLNFAFDQDELHIDYLAERLVEWRRVLAVASTQGSLRLPGNWKSHSDVSCKQSPTRLNSPAIWLRSIPSRSRPSWPAPLTANF